MKKYIEIIHNVVEEAELIESDLDVIALMITAGAFAIWFAIMPW